ncbi:hypothetical protein EOJ36_00645 [Sandaracinomonas limnophila]|uniref:Uncharacterized protein n=1 Tax=Sandaracinomonas limnophila TaxID=1862386 RepID=A0A437PWA0_9BACT|nr:hypothetical protein [Sandaracinomonas limnophila]RVU26536.1 hypothetical protein EOJ36_00645 [Sandaracinomonas limnophila]
MKANLSITIILISYFFSFYSIAQNTSGIHFQALARDQFNNPAKGKSLFIETSILNSNVNGQLCLKEVFLSKTNESGIFNLQLGTGKKIDGLNASIRDILWQESNYFLNIKIAILPENFSNGLEYSGNLIDLGTSPIGLVPHAITANNVIGLEKKLNIADTSSMLKPYNIQLGLKTSKVYVDNLFNTPIPNEKIIGLEGSKIIGDIKGNAATSTKLLNAKKINGIIFDGTSDITITTSTGDEPLILSGNTNQYFRGDKTWQILTKNTVGLSNVENTSDADKPISTATQSALANKLGINENATSATKLTTARTINGIAFDGTADITIPTGGSGSTDASALTGTTLASGVVSSSLTSVGNLTAGGIPYSLLTGTVPTWNQNTSGNAATATIATTANSATIANSATKLTTARTINGVAFDGTANITIPTGGSASTDASALTGTTLASGVVSSSLTSVGTISSGTWNGTTISIAKGGTGATTAETARTALGLGNVNNTSDADKPVSSATLTAINNKEDLSNKSNSVSLGGASANNDRYPSQLAVKTFIENTVSGSMAGNSATSTKLATARNINGVAFDGTADITIPTGGSGFTDASALTGTTLASGVISSSLTSVGTISSGTWNGTTISIANGGTGATTAATARTALGAEPSISAGTTSQYFRGDKTFQTLDKATIGLSNVDNTSDLNKPISSATQTALDTKLALNANAASATSATKLTTARNINGISFDGSTNITIPAEASSLTGTTLASNIVSSSLTSVGTISSGTWNGTPISISNGGTGATNAANARTALGAEPSISAGTNSQYFRGDKTFQTLDKATIGLSNVDNTSDLNKPISTATQTALDNKLEQNANAISATTASKLSTARDINGVSFDGSTNITIPAEASALTGTTLASNIVSSSLTSVGTISSGTWNGSTISVNKGGTGTANLNGILLGKGTNSVSTASYGAFYDTSIQTLALANTAYAMKLNTTDFASGVSIESNGNGVPTRIKVANAGKYNLQFSAQLDRSTGTSAEDVSIWLRKNESDIAYSATDISITGGTATSAPTVAAWNFFLNLNANDYVEIMWSGSATNLIIKSQGARTSPIRPEIPSLIVTLQQIY